MREIVLVGTRSSQEIKSLVVSEIALNEIPPNALQNIDSLIFTSKYAITSLIESAKKHPDLQVWKDLPSYVIGGASAKELELVGANIAYIGSDGYGTSFAQELTTLLENKSPLYLRAQHIVSKLDEKLLGAGVRLRQIIAYINQPKKLPPSLRPKSHSVLIFVSPSAFVFFKQIFGWDANYIAVAIGMTTFSTFDSDIMAFVSSHRSIDACIEMAKDLAQRIP